MKKKLLSIACIIAILLTNTATLSIAAIAFDEMYKVNEDEKLISRIMPETTVEIFKSKTSEQLTVYKDETKTEKVDTGLIGTGMVVVKDATGEEYTVSVIGDLNGDGKATQVELTNIIRHIVGLENAELTGIKYESADITGDKAVDQRDISKLVKYIVTGELDIDNDNKNQSTIEATTKEIKTDSVKIEAVVKDLVTGSIKHATTTVYVKKSGESDTSYSKKYTGTDSELTIDGLDSNTDYDIKIEAKDEQGNVVTKVIKVKTANIEGNITFGTITWSSGKASTTIATDSSYEIEYQINSKTGTWLKASSATSQITVDNLSYNDKLYARLTNGTTSTEPKELTIKDEILPTVSVSLTEGTQKLTATATAIDNESGIAADVKYKFSIKEKDANDSTYVEKQNTTSATCEITGLTEGKEYTVKVEVSDIAGNIGTKEETIMIPDDVSPVVGLTLTPTTSTIVATATATATDVGGLPTNTIYKFSIKKTAEDDSTYVVKQNNSDANCTITGLEQNTSYTVKVEVADKAGNVGTKTETTITTSVPDNAITGAITFGSTSWSSGKASITVSTNTSYTIEYQVNSTSGSWTKASAAGTNVIVNNLNNNDVVYARLTDGTNSGNHASVTIADLILPTVTLTLSNATTSSITATAVATDNESGIAASTMYKFSIKKTSESDSSYVVEQNSTNNSYTIIGLEQSTQYTVKVEVADIAGNVGTKTAIISTESIPDETQSGAITFGSVTWSSGKAKVTISTNTSYTIEYQVNSTSGSWTKASSAGTDVTVSNLNNNDVVYARLTDGTTSGNSASVTITDTVTPTVTLTLSNEATNSITATAVATDNESGIGLSATYKFSVKKTSEDDSKYVVKQNTTDKICMITGLEQNTSYTVKVEVEDVAGNAGAKTATTITTSVPDSTVSGAIAFGTATWSAGKAEIIVSTNTSYTIEYQVNSTSGTWTKVNAGSVGGTNVTVSNLNNGDVVYARLTDGTSSGNHASVTIADTVVPTVTLTLSNEATNSITATAVATDSESGIAADVTYKFSVKKTSEDDSKYVEKQNTTSATCTITGLEQNTSYTVKVEVEDVAENVGTKTATTTTTSVPDSTVAGAITFGSATWSAGKAEIIVSTNTSYTIEYQVNSTSGTWTKVNVGAVGGTNVTVSNLNNGDVVYARLTDGTNAGNYANVTIADLTVPTVTLTLSNATTNSITATANATDNESGIGLSATYKFSIKKTSEDDSNYVVKQNTTDKTCTITGLEQNTSYTVKVEIEDAAGNAGTKTATESTVLMPDNTSSGAITFGNVTWNAGKAEITVTTNTSFTIEYQVNATTEGSWRKATSGTTSVTINNLNNNDIVYARLTDGTSTGDSINKTIVDNAEPTVTLTLSNETTNSITATAVATDSESGIATDAKYKFSIKKTSEDDSNYVEKQNTTSDTCTITGLEQNVSYTVKVEVEDVAGNVGTKTATTNTVTVPDSTVAGAITFETATWDSGKAEITVSTTTSYTIEYQINSTAGAWTKVNTGAVGGTSVTVSNLNHNDIVYARLTDGTSSGNHASVTIADGIAPTVTLTLSNQTTNSITATAVATDNESGIGLSATYKFSIKKASEDDSKYVEKQKTTSNTCVITDLEQNTSYTVKVEVEDVAGNAGTKTATASTITVPDSTTLGAITFGNVTWNNGKAEIKISTDTSYMIEYQINSTTSNWVRVNAGVAGGTSVTVSNLNSGDIVYARLTDGVNTGNYANVTIADTTAPTVTLTLSNETTSSIVATATAKDDESGISIATYKFSIKKTSEPDSSYVIKQNTAITTCTITGLEQNTNYTVKVEVEDGAGNIGVKTETAITTSMPDSTVSGAITFGTATWDSGKAEITISTNTSYTIEYQINSTSGSWTKVKTGAAGGTSITVSNLNNNDIVYARLTDGTSSGNHASITITDGIAPTANLTLSNVTSNSITATAVATDNESGISATATYKFSIKKASEDDSKYVVKQNTTDKTCTITGLEQNTSYIVKVEVEDIAGNTGVKTATTTTTSVPDSTVAGAITFGNAVWNAGKASVVVSTNTSYTIEYQVNSTAGAWTKVNTGVAGGTSITVSNLNHNDIVYARLTDGTSSGNHANVTIADTTAPTVTLTLSGTTNSMVATVDAVDNESGISAVATYKFSIKKTSENDSSYVVKQNTADKTCTITGLEQNTSYTVKVEVEDIAGNTGVKTATTTTSILITSITLNKTVLELTEGDEETLTATIEPTEATNKEIEWSSSENKIATVDTTGKVTAVAEGTTTITATAKDGSGKFVNCTVNVKAKSTVANMLGEYINYPIDLNGDGDTTNDWMIFYKADGNAEGEKSTGAYYANIGDYYIIAADYLKNTDSRLELEKMGNVTKSGNYTIYWATDSDIPSKVQKTGKEGLEGTGRTINQLFMQYGATMSSSFKEDIEMSTLINTENWAGYVNSNYADYAIGGPTIEMWVASWNGTYGETKKLYTTGTKIGTNTAPTQTYVNLKSVTDWDKNKLYFPNMYYYDSDLCHGYMLASTGNAYDASQIWCVQGDGRVGLVSYRSSYWCLRPVVHLKSGTTLTKNSLGIWEFEKGADTTAPTVTLTLSNATSNSITATANATDDESGIATDATYKFSIKKTNDDDSTYVVKQNTTSKICTITGLEQNTIYTVKVEVADASGNIGTKIFTTVTTAVPDGTQIGAVTFGDVTWNNSKASVTVSTNTNYTIEYQVNALTEGNWTKETTGTAGGTSVTVSNLNNGDIVYARLTDGTNVGNHASVTVVAILTTSITLNKTTLELTEEDEETLTATISPTNATNKQVTWSTNANSIATVDTTGKITAVAKGTAIITATAKDGSGKSASCTVTVESAIKAEYVDYPIDLNGDGDTTNDWMLFYKADGNAEGEETGGAYAENVGDYYIIAADYLKNTDSRLKLSQMGTVTKKGNYNIYWNKLSDLPERQVTGTESKNVNGRTNTSTTINKLFMQNKFGALNSNENSRAVSTLINTVNWDGYVNSTYADYAIGAPTLEMWVASWNAAYGDKLKLYTNENSIGYYVGKDSNSTTTNGLVITSVTNWQKNTLYFPHGDSEYSSCDGSWFASPSAGSTDYAGNLMKVTYRGFVFQSGYDSDGLCARPLVHLRSDIQLEKNATTGIWEKVN